MGRRTLSAVAVAAVIATALFLWRPWAEPVARRSPASTNGVPRRHADADGDRGRSSGGKHPTGEATAKRAAEPGAPGRITLLPPPADPIEVGSCALRLALRDIDSGQPASSEVRLWRLDAPGNEHYTAGDQFQRKVRVPKKGLQLQGLAAGRYRAICLGALWATDDPEAFEVGGVETHVTLGIRAPRNYRVYLKLYGPDGQLFDRATWSGRQTYVRNRIRPSWKVKERKLRDPERYGTLGLGGAVGAGGRHTRPARFSSRGLSVGRVAQDTVGWRTKVTRWMYPGATKGRKNSPWVRTEVIVQGPFAEDLQFVARTVQEAPIRESVYLPDGRRASHAKAKFRIYCPAVPVRNDVEPDWRQLPIRVHVVLSGYETLQFEVSPSDPLQPRVLRPQPSR